MGTRMRAMLAAVIGMGVLIVVGVATLVVTVVRRLSTVPVQVATVLDEPSGTRMLGMTSTGDRLAVLLQGGGPDRIVMVDPRSGQIVGQVALPR